MSKLTTLKPFEEWPFVVPSISKSVNRINKYTEKVKQANSASEVLRVIKQVNNFSDKIENEFVHISVLYSLDTTNKQYEDAMNVLNEGLPLLENADVLYKKALMESPFRAEIENKLGSFIFKKFEYNEKVFDEKIINELVAENKLTMEYDALIAGCQVPYNGEVYNLPQMGKFMQDSNREVRKSASKAYYSYLETRVDEIEEIFDKLVKIRDTMAKKLGFKNYVELAYYRMHRYDYTPEDVAAYREQIRAYVTPLASKLTREQFKRTEIKRPEIYDLSLVFKDGNPTPKGTTQDKIEAAKEMYDALSTETSYFFRFMSDHHVMDLEAKPGKQSGGYMTYFPVYEIPFIFSNFNGTSGDVDVLTHEFGHSFQAYMSRGIKIPEYRSPTMESCEIHSMSMEFFAHPYMDKFFSNPDRYKFAHLVDSISFLPYGVTVDEFQHWVYENPEATKAQRDEKWHELEVKYTPYKVNCYKGCKYMKTGHRWLTQGHIFASPFYYIDYTLAQVMAFQFFNLDRKSHDVAWKKYLKLCASGGKYPFRTLVTKCKLKDPFTKGVVASTIKPLTKVLKTYNID